MFSLCTCFLVYLYTFIVPPPAAIANAIYRAVGVRMTELPMSPARVVEAMK